DLAVIVSSWPVAHLIFRCLTPKRKSALRSGFRGGGICGTVLGFSPKIGLYQNPQDQTRTGNGPLEKVGNPPQFKNIPAIERLLGLVPKVMVETHPSIAEWDVAETISTFRFLALAVFVAKIVQRLNVRKRT